MRSGKLACLALGLVLALSSPAWAQEGGGFLRGYVKDESGAVLPGVTVTATSQELLQPSVAVTDETGLYRLNNLPPGTYVIQAELAGFATHRREGILVRAGADVHHRHPDGAEHAAETITVSGESPMIETSKPTTSITLDRELIRAAPISSRRVFSDALDLAPGRLVAQRRRRRRPAVLLLQGRGDLLARLHARRRARRLVPRLVGALDRLRRRHGPGLRAEVGRRGRGVTDRHRRGDEHHRAARRQPVQGARRSTTTRTSKWNSDNTKGGAAPGGLPTAQSVKQSDLSLGGPIMRDKVWFFASFRRADLTNGISRSAFNTQNVIANDPNFESFDNFLKSNQPFVKVTAQVTPKHEVTGFYQNDRSRYTSNRELDNSAFLFNSTGGGLVPRPHQLGLDRTS